MKKVKAFTNVELLIVVASILILGSIILAVVEAPPSRDAISHNGTNSTISIQVGDTVYIDTLSITGVVNEINEIHDRYPLPQKATLLIKGTNGIPNELQNVDVRLLKKVQPTPQG